MDVEDEADDETVDTSQVDVRDMTSATDDNSCINLDVDDENKENSLGETTFEVL